MRVLFVTHSFPQRRGDAAGAFILHLAQALAAAGTDVRVLAPAGQGLPSHDTIDGIEVRRFRYAPRRWETLAYAGTMAEQVSGSMRGKATLAGLLSGGAMAVRRAVATLAPDVVHAHWWFPSGLSVLASGVHRPLVTTLHGSDVRLAGQSRLAPRLLARVLRRSGAVTAVSTWLADEARRLAGDTDIEIAPMPANVSLFSPGGARSASRLLYVGRLNAQKGIGLLLDALAMTSGGAALDIAGDGPDRAALEARAAALGIAGRMTWRGAVPQERLVELYRNATAVVVPSTDEGLGLVAVEAQLCEAPVIAARSGGIPDVVRDGESGVLVAPDDASALASAIDAMLARPDRGAALARRGRQCALERFAPAAVAQRYRAIYDRMVAGVA